MTDQNIVHSTIVQGVPGAVMGVGGGKFDEAADVTYSTKPDNPLMALQHGTAGGMTTTTTTSTTQYGLSGEGRAAFGEFAPLSFSPLLLSSISIISALIVSSDKEIIFKVIGWEYKSGHIGPLNSVNFS